MQDVLTRSYSLTTDEIAQLQAQRDYPSVSILLPIYGNAPDERQQTPIRVKNLLRQAEERLLKEFPARDIAPLLDRLHAMVTEVDYDHGTHGLAIFASANFARFYYLPFPVDERLGINHHFATRDLIIARSRSSRYFVLSLTEKSAHLYEGVRDQLREIEDFGFPVEREIEGVKTELPGTFGVEVTKLHDGEEREYFSRVQRALEGALAQEPLPLALAGVERTLAYFDEATSHKGKPKFNVVARLTGNYEKVRLREMAGKIWPMVETSMKAGQKRVKERLADATSANRKVTGLREVWKAAQAGRVDTLLAEESYHPATRTNGKGLRHAAEGEGFASLDDAVDAIIQQVLSTGGEVTFFDADELAHDEHIAAVLRY